MNIRYENRRKPIWGQEGIQQEAERGKEKVVDGKYEQNAMIYAYETYFVCQLKLL